jgi:hypothetical protein
MSGLLSMFSNWDKLFIFSVCVAFTLNCAGLFFQGSWWLFFLANLFINVMAMLPKTSSSYTKKHFLPFLEKVSVLCVKKILHYHYSLTLLTGRFI